MNGDNNNNVKPPLFVIKRNSGTELFDETKIRKRLERLVQKEPVLTDVNLDIVLRATVSGVFGGIKTTELDELSAQTCAYLITENPSYGHLASRISISNLQKESPLTFSEYVDLCSRNFRIGKNNERWHIITPDVEKFVQKHSLELDGAIDPERDYMMSYFGFKVMELLYLKKIHGVVCQTPQYLFMIESIAVCGVKSIANVLKCYENLSKMLYTHATPTLLNACFHTPQLSSCFLLSLEDDSIEGEYSLLKKCALIAKTAGGIGMSVSDVRARDSTIHSTGKGSRGVCSMLGPFDKMTEHVNQSGSRPASIAVYLTVWHKEFLDLLESKKNFGADETRRRNLFIAGSVNDIFMRRVANDEKWSLFCPDECPGLTRKYGREFEELYKKYERACKKKVTVRARDVYDRIVDSCIETGMPFHYFLDSANRKTNHQHLGTVKCSNLCTEIVEFSSEKETAVCNLASLSLPKYVNGKTFDFAKLRSVVHEIVDNLNTVVTKTYYPTIESKKSNTRHRPIGIGVQGLADVFHMLELPFDSKEAMKLNAEIFENIYFAALDASCEIAKVKGTYSSYNGSPTSRGILQMDMWEQEAKEFAAEKIDLAKKMGLDIDEDLIKNPVRYSGKLDWPSLRNKIKQCGLANSLLVAPMPTASTSQLMGNNECIEPYTSNMYTRRVLAGEFIVVNERLIKRLSDKGIWDERMKHMIIEGDGSVQHIDSIDEQTKSLFKTAWEISIRAQVEMAAWRAPFIDQSQSLNLFYGDSSPSSIGAGIFRIWTYGLKTGYYTRVRPKAAPIKFTMDKEMLKKTTPSKAVSEGDSCQIGCDSCGA